MTLQKLSLKHVAIGFLAALTLVAGIAVAEAAEDPANIIKYRQNMMKAITGHISAIAAVAKGEVSYTGHVAAHARAIEATARMIVDVFPKGSHVGETRAKPEIWQDRAKFEAAAGALVAASGALASTAEAGGDVAAIGDKLGDVGKACGGCHKPFRKKKE